MNPDDSPTPNMLSVPPPMHAQGGDEYISVLTEAVSGCKAFVLICSTTYGNTQFTKAEFNLANSEKKVCITQGLMREAFLWWYVVSPAHSSPPLPLSGHHPGVAQWDVPA